MKTILAPNNLANRTCRRAVAFTLVEMMVGMGIFIGVFVGVMVGLQVYGLKVYTLSATKLSATADARKTLNLLRTQIRSSKSVYVGNYANAKFSRIANNLPQAGNALEIFFADTNGEPGDIPLVYYQNSSGSDNALYSVSNNAVTMMANYVTNNIVFTAEDYQANVLTTYDNNPVIRVTLNFYQWEFPIGFIGTNALNAYNFYRLQTRISPRAR